MDTCLFLYGVPVFFVVLWSIVLCYKNGMRKYNECKRCNLKSMSSSQQVMLRYINSGLLCVSDKIYKLIDSGLCPKVNSKSIFIKILMATQHSADLYKFQVQIKLKW